MDVTGGMWGISLRSGRAKQGCCRKRHLHRAVPCPRWQYLFVSAICVQRLRSDGCLDDLRISAAEKLGTAANVRDFEMTLCAPAIPDILMMVWGWNVLPSNERADYEMLKRASCQPGQFGGGVGLTTSSVPAARAPCCACVDVLDIQRFYIIFFSYQEDVGGQVIVPSRSWDSIRDVAHFLEQSRDHVHGNHVAVRPVLRRTLSELHFLNTSVRTRPLNEHVHAVRRFLPPGTDAHRVLATANRPSPVTHHGFCELELRMTSVS